MIDRFRANETLHWQTQETLTKTNEELRASILSVKRLKSELELERRAKENAQRVCNETEEQLRHAKREATDLTWSLEAAVAKQRDLEAEVDSANQRISEQMDRNNQMMRSQQGSGIASMYLTDLGTSGLSTG